MLQRAKTLKNGREGDWCRKYLASINVRPEKHMPSSGPIRYPAAKLRAVCDLLGKWRVARMPISRTSSAHDNKV
jgi:hypothetical protein